MAVKAGTQESEDLEGEVDASELTHIVHALTFLAGTLMQSFPPRILPGVSMHNTDGKLYYSPLERKRGCRVRQTHVQISTHLSTNWVTLGKLLNVSESHFPLCKSY